MKFQSISIFVTIFFVSFSPINTEAQEMRIEGDSIIADFGGKKIKIDSIQIETWIQKTSKDMDNIQHQIKEIEFEKLKLVEKELELTKKQKDIMKNYALLFDMRFEHFRLKKQLEDKK